ncbi:MAG: ABC transporter permease [Bacteroidota bacterium]
MNTLINLKTSLRSIRKRPAFAAIIIFTIAIVTGTSIVVYSYIDALLLSQLPFKNAERLVRIQSIKGQEKGLLSYPEFLDMQNELIGIEELAVYRDGGRYNLSGDGLPPEDLTVTFASSNLFKLLGVNPIIGNHWPETLDKRGSHTVMLTYDFWQRRFSGKEEVEGLEITLDGFSYSNYGVLPQGFSFPNKVEAFRAMAFADFVVDSRDRRLCIGLARLKPGVTLDQINEELKSYGVALEERYLKSNLGISFVAEPLADLFVGELNGYLVLISVAVLFLLIIAAVNISNLIVSQAIKRSKETVIRKVLGSSNLLIIKEFVINSLVLSFIGSIVGLLLAWCLIEISGSLVNPYLPHWIEVGINKNVLMYAFLLAMIFGIATGLVPWFFHFSRDHKLHERLKEGQQTTGSHRQHHLQKGLAILQVFVCVLLLIGGGLLFKSFHAAQQAELGYHTDQMITFRIALSWFKYGDPEKKRAFFESSLNRISAIPGVIEVAINTMPPLTDIVKTSRDSQSLFTVEGQSEVDQSKNPFVSTQRVTPNYFEMMGIEILKGMGFSDSDYASNEFHVIIDDKLANQLWPEENPIGKRMQLGGNLSNQKFLTIIGVADNVKHQSIISENIPSIYISLLSYTTTDAYYIVKTNLSLATLEPKLMDAILSLDENQPTFEYMQMTDHVEKMNWQSRISSILFLTIAAIGSVIAAIGLFSMMTFIMILKVKELALRKVLGANEQNILLLVMKDLVSISGVGIGLGLLLAPLILQPILPFLFEVALVDVDTYVLVAIALIVLSLMAAAAPSWKALYVNPVTVLRRD